MYDSFPRPQTAAGQCEDHGWRPHGTPLSCQNGVIRWHDRVVDDALALGVWEGIREGLQAVPCRDGTASTPRCALAIDLDLSLDLADAPRRRELLISVAARETT